MADFEERFSAAPVTGEQPVADTTDPNTIAGAFKEGAMAGFGEQPTGPKPEELEVLPKPLQRPAYALFSGVETWLRSANALASGAGATVGEAIAQITGLNEAGSARARRDWAQFFTVAPMGAGETAPRGMPKSIEAVADNFHDQVIKPTIERAASNPTAIEPIAGSDVPTNVPRSQLALTGEPHVDAVINHPILKNVIDNPIIDREHEIPNSWGGSLPIDNPVTYIDKEFPRALTVDGVVFDPAHGAVVHENVEEAVIMQLQKGGMDRDAALRAAYWGWGNPAEHALYRTHGMDPDHVEAALKPYLDQIAARKVNPANIPDDLFKETYPNGNPLEDTPGQIDKPSAEEMARAKQIIADWQAKGAPSPEAKTPQLTNPLAEARDLGVIGPERVPHPDDTPAQAAQRAIPATQRFDPNDKITMTPAGEPIDAYQKRFAEWVSKIKHPGDIDNLIARAAAENDYFPQARAGEIPAAHIETIARSSGFDSTKFDPKLLRARFNSDDEIRAVEQTLLQARDDYRGALEKARANPSPENVNAALDAKARHENALEYVAAFRSDWGKAGLAQQEFLRNERRREQYKERDRNGVTKEPNDLIAATENFATSPTKAGLNELIQAAQKAVDAAKPKEAEGAAPKAPPPPGVSDLVNAAEDALNTLRGKGQKHPLDRLVAAADRAAGPRKITVQRSVAQQFPPELQALIDKAERVTKRFGGIDRDKAEVAAAAEATAGLDKEGFAYVMGKAFDVAKTMADKTDALFWLRNNWLLSGPITHTFYFAVNTGTAIAEHVLTPAVAAMIDKVRGGQNNFFGESFAGLLGIGHAVPGAWRAAWQAGRTGLRVPLESELRLAERGEESPQARGGNIPYLAHASPDWGAIKAAADWLGVPMAARTAAELTAGGAFGRFANLQHTLFKVLGEGANAHRNAYVATVKEGLSPLTSSQFADRYAYHLKNPTDDALRDNVNAGYTGTFMEKLGDKTQRLASALKDTPLRWEFPFLHVPLNLTRRGVAYSPLAFAGPEMRATLMGERGARPQALALARFVTGTAALSYVLNQALQGKVTGDYPTDPKERARWKLYNIQPNSFQWGEEWVSYNRFGPARIPLTIGANIGQIASQYDTTKDADEEMAKAVGSGIVATVHALSDEVGMLAMHQFLEANESQRGLAQFGAGEFASFLPYNVGLGQLAAYDDPYMRQVKGFTDGLKYRLPLLRETLPAKRDPVYGEPIPSPAYHSFVRSSPVVNDPIKAELDRLDYHPGAPGTKVGHVQLTPKQYDKYEATAGPLVKQALGEMINDPDYQGNDREWQAQEARKTVAWARKEARKTLQLDELHLIDAGVDSRRTQILGTQ